MPESHLLTGAYALDALDDVERAGFERHLRSCSSCPAEVIEFQESAAALADRVALAPPDYLRERVLAEVARTRQLSPGGRASLPRPSLRRILATAAAAVVIAGAAGLGGIAWQGQRAAHQHEVEAGTLARVMTDPSRIEVVGLVTGGGRAAVTAAHGSAVFAADDLPKLSANQEYQLWVIHDQTKIRSAGMLTLQSGTGQALLSGVNVNDAVAVSVEPAGGSKQPTTTPIVALSVA